MLVFAVAYGVIFVLGREIVFRYSILLLALGVVATRHLHAECDRA